MNAIREELIKKESFYTFLCEYFTNSEFEVFALAGDASTRKYFRIVSAGKSYVLMAWEPFTDDDDYPFLSVLRHFNLSGVHVPSILSKNPAAGLILLEDLGDLTLERKFWETSNQKDILPYYKLAMDELLKIHTAATDNKSACTAFKIAFDTDKLLWEMNYARKHFLEDFLAINFTKDESDILDSNFHKICTHLSSQPQVICHRDYHSRNVMFKLGKIFVIDFQDARLGPKQYDLVSLLKDSYVNLSDESQEILLTYYFDQWMNEKQEDLNTEAFFSTYNLQTVQRCFKACGSFASFYNAREDLRYLKYLKPTIKSVLNTLSSIDDSKDLYILLDNKISTNEKLKNL